jgi:hypothetical protein
MRQRIGLEQQPSFLGDPHRASGSVDGTAHIFADESAGCR